MGELTVLKALERRTAPVHLWQGRDQVSTWSASTLREAAASWAQALHGHGVGPGRVVATSATTSLELVAAILGAWRCGAAIVVLPEANPGDAAGMRRMSDGLDQLQVVVMLAEGILPSDLQALVPTVLPLADGPPASHGTAGMAADADDLNAPALMQLTSGSTGRAKVVPISHRMLAANCEATASRLGVAPDDHMLSWLPLTHDMGFGGALCLALRGDLVLTLLPTALFAQSPLNFLHAMSQQRATLSPNPPSAYALLARLGRRAARESINLAHWRFAWAGAEPVFAHVLRAFESAMQPLGLRTGVLQPAYGMAEAVVAVSFAPAGRPWRSLALHGRALREQGVVLLQEAAAEASDDVIELVSNGAPLDGMQVQARDAAGHPLPPGRLGTLWIHGHSVAPGYLHHEEPQRFADGWCNTGDQGFLWEGEVYVSGRVKDIVARGGVKVGAHEIEAAAEVALDLRPGRVAAFAHLDHAHGRETVVVVIARRFDGAEPAMQRRVAEAVLSRCAVAIDACVFTASGPLPRTTSGKLQRGLVRDYWLGGGYADAERASAACASAPRPAEASGNEPISTT
jgi:acyl-CoA synthetase (AMP-forming)/AMP-acid ligase II